MIHYSARQRLDLPPVSVEASSLLSGSGVPTRPANRILNSALFRAQRLAGARQPASSAPAASPLEPDVRPGRRRARLSFLIPFFALLLGALSPFAAADTPRNVWSATLTVKTLTGFRLGCTTGELNIALNCSTEATLSDDEFTVGAKTYFIRRIQFFFDDDILQLRFSAGPNTALKALNFCVGTTAYSLSRMNSPVVFWDNVDVGLVRRRHGHAQHREFLLAGHADGTVPGRDLERAGGKQQHERGRHVQRPEPSRPRPSRRRRRATRRRFRTRRRMRS